MAVSSDVAELELFEESVGFSEVAIFVAPARIVFDPEAEGIVLNWIDNSRV